MLNISVVDHLDGTLSLPYYVVKIDFADIPREFSEKFSRIPDIMMEAYFLDDEDDYQHCKDILGDCPESQVINGITIPGGLLYGCDLVEDLSSLGGKVVGPPEDRQFIKVAVQTIEDVYYLKTKYGFYEEEIGKVDEKTITSDDVRLHAGYRFGYLRNSSYEDYSGFIVMSYAGNMNYDVINEVQRIYDMTGEEIMGCGGMGYRGRRRGGFNHRSFKLESREGEFSISSKYGFKASSASWSGFAIPLREHKGSEHYESVLGKIKLCQKNLYISDIILYADSIESKEFIDVFKFLRI